MAKEKEGHKKPPHAGHGFTDTHIKHHADGSHTVHHVHEMGPEHDVEHAVGDLDGAHDSMEDNLGTPNAGEAAANAGQAGIPAAAGAPAAAAAPAPMGA
jgi:hypothetical protein